MVKRFNDHSSQLEAESAVALTNEAKLSLYKKSQKSGISTDILEEVYRRGFNTWSEKFSGTPEQFAFDRVNSFIAGGFAEMLDEDLKKACWKGYEAIGMKMKNGKKVPNCVPVKEEDAEAHSKDFTKPSSRFIGSDELVTVYKTQTPGQIIKRVVRECLEEGDVIRTKFATKNLQKRGIEGPHPIEGKDIYRLWATSKVAPDDAQIAYHGHNARIIHKGKHTDIKHGSVSAGYAGDLKASVIRKQAPKKSGNVVPMKEEELEEKFGDEYMKKGREFAKIKRAKIKAAKTPQLSKEELRKQAIELTKGVKVTKVNEIVSDIEEATYQGKKVPLNKPMKGDVKKSKVFVDPDGDGKAKKVNFGDKSLSIKKHIPARKKSYCARSGGQGNLTDKTSANYWSRRAWNCEETEVNELSVPAGTTGKRKEVSTPSVAVRMASGKIEKHPPGKSGSSGGGDE